MAASFAALVGAVPGQRSHAQDAKRPIGAIEVDLVSNDPKVWAKAAAELTPAHPDAALAVPMLLDLLDDERPEVASAAVKSLDALIVQSALHIARSCFGPDLFEKDASLQVVASLKDPTVCGAIGKYPEPNGRFREQFVPGDFVRAALVAADPRRSREPFGILSYAIRTTNGPTRLNAAAAMSLCAGDTIEHREPSNALPAPAVIASSRQLLKSQHDLQAWAGLRILRRLRARDPDTVKAVIEVLTATKETRPKSGGERERPLAPEEACRALRAMGAAADGAIPILIDLVSKPLGTDVSSWDGVETLLAIGGEPQLRTLVAKKPPNVVYLVAAAAELGRLHDVALTYLLPFEESDWYVVPALGAMGKAAGPALETLRKQASRSEDTHAALNYADAILAISPDDADALAFLHRTVADEAMDRRARDRAWRTLARRAPPSAATYELLARAFAKDNPARPFDHWQDVLERLSSSGEAARSAMPDLLREAKERTDFHKTPSAMTREDPRRAFASAFARLGPIAAPALPTLENWRTSGGETIRVLAAQAIRRIKSAPK